MNVSYSCPHCLRSGVYENSLAGGQLHCLHCTGCFEVDAQGHPQPVLAAVAVAADHPVTAACLGYLDNLEAKGKRMTEGAVRFLFDGLPQWLARFARSLVRIGAKALRVLVIFSVWFAVTFLPLALVMFAGWFPKGPYTVLFVLLWTILAAMGSVWGLKHAQGAWPRLRWLSRVKRPKTAGTAIVAGTR